MAQPEKLSVLFREHSAQLDEKLARFFAPRVGAIVPPRPGCINEYGSVLAESDGPTPQKWNDMSHLGPADLPWEDKPLSPRPVPRRAPRAASEPAPGEISSRPPSAPAASKVAPAPRQPPRQGGRGPSGRPPRQVVQSIWDSLDRMGTVPALLSPLPKPAGPVAKLQQQPLRASGSTAAARHLPEAQRPLGSGAPQTAGGASAGAPTNIHRRAREPTDDAMARPPKRARSTTPPAAATVASPVMPASVATTHSTVPPRRAISEGPSATGAPTTAAVATPVGGQAGALGAVAAALPGTLRSAAASAPREGVAELQAQGRKMKRLAEKKMEAAAGPDGAPRPTHVSAYFLAQAGVKFLASAAALEEETRAAGRLAGSKRTQLEQPPRPGAPLLYTQTAALLDSAARSAAAATGPELVTTATALLCERLAACARLRAAHLRRADLAASFSGFAAAVDKASGETFLRGSPTDSSLSSSSTVVAAGGGGADVVPKPSRAPTPGGGVERATVRTGTIVARPAAAAPAPAKPPTAASAEEVLLPLPRAAVEAQLAAVAEAQAVFTALSGLTRSAERLRALAARAQAEGCAAAERAAAATLLAAADAGQGPPGVMLALARDALADILKIA